MARIARQLGGEFWECGVFRGGTASIIADAIRADNLTLRLFDTFTGIPYRDEVDLHIVGQFANTQVEGVKEFVNYPNTVIHTGVIPDTFVGLESSKIAFCHVDVDMYRSIRACCEFVWPRLMEGGVMVFDDYVIKTCPGARLATDEFFADKRAYLVQTFAEGAVVFKPPQG
jgi:O-methyltransferase